MDRKEPKRTRTSKEQLSNLKEYYETWMPEIKKKGTGDQIEAFTNSYNKTVEEFTNLSKPQDKVIFHQKDIKSVGDNEKNRQSESLIKTSEEEILKHGHAALIKLNDAYKEIADQIKNSKPSKAENADESLGLHSEANQ